jgi:4-hydroxybenzoate polyprenyltransferase
MNKNIIIGGVIFLIIFFIILWIASIWIGLIGMLVCLGIIIYGCLAKPMGHVKQEVKDD